LKLEQRLLRLFASRHFFTVVVILFVFESVWISVSAVYPQAFDEQFHFGLIQIYSHYLLPFLSHQPAHADAYGAVARDPSYLYHYLMSFPYRVVSVFTSDQTIQIICLRLINVCFGVVTLILSRKILIKVGLSKTFANLASAIYALIPIVPQLSGQLNYDNLLLPLGAAVILLTIRAIEEITAGKPRLKTLIFLISLCFITVLVQYEFLAIFAAIWLFLIYISFRKFKPPGKLWRLLKADWQRLGRLWKWALLASFIISFGLFFQRDGINLVQYHTLNPECSRVLSIKSCDNYNVWQSSYSWHASVVNHTTANIKLTNPVAYTGEWIYWLWYRLFFAVNGPVSGYTNYPPLPLPVAAAALLGVVGVVLVVVKIRSFKSKPVLQFFILAALLYLAFLWADGYMQYKYTHVLVLMNGRYVLPVIFLMAAVIGSALTSFFKNIPKLKLLAATVILLLFLEGGGLLTFVVRSDASWDWPSSFVVKMNNDARKVIWPVVFEGPKTYTTTVWRFN